MLLFLYTLIFGLLCNLDDEAQQNHDIWTGADRENRFTAPSVEYARELRDNLEHVEYSDASLYEYNQYTERDLEESVHILTLDSADKSESSSEDRIVYPINPNQTQLPLTDVQLAEIRTHTVLSVICFVSFLPPFFCPHFLLHFFGYYTSPKNRFFVRKFFVLFQTFITFECIHTPQIKSEQIFNWFFVTCVSYFTRLSIIYLCIFIFSLKKVTFSIFLTFFVNKLSEVCPHSTRLKNNPTDF